MVRERSVPQWAAGTRRLRWRLEGSRGDAANMTAELQRLQTENAILKAGGEKRDADQIAACSTKTESIYRELGFSEKGPTDGHTLSAFQNHFSRKYKRCFMLLTTTNYGDGSVLVSEQLFDAFERHDFGAMDLFSKPPGAPGMLVTCTFELPGETKRTCRSKDEFDVQARAAMET